jgi:small subunit ribosomal protein S17
VNKLVEKKDKTRNIGLNVKPPDENCKDENCPFHGKLSVRGQVISGVVSSTKMQHSILVKKEFMHYVKKFERYEKRSSTFSVHCPPCIKVAVGDKIKIAECKPLSKNVSFVTIEKI